MTQRTNNANAGVGKGIRTTDSKKVGLKQAITRKGNLGWRKGGRCSCGESSDSDGGAGLGGRGRTSGNRRFGWIGGGGGSAHCSQRAGGRGRGGGQRLLSWGSVAQIRIDFQKGVEQGVDEWSQVLACDEVLQELDEQKAASDQRPVGGGGVELEEARREHRQWVGGHSRLEGASELQELSSGEKENNNR